MSVSVSQSFRHPFTDHQAPPSPTPDSAAASSASAARIRSRSLSTEESTLRLLRPPRADFLRRDPIVIRRRRGIPRRPP